MKRFGLIILLISLCFVSPAQNLFSVQGQIVNKANNEPIPFVSVLVEGQTERYALSDLEGRFEISGLRPGIFRLRAESLNYETSYSQELQISAQTPPVEIKMQLKSKRIGEVVVRASLLKPMVESPLSMRSVGMQQIEKSPGANRDISKVVQSFAGVSYSPAGYRNDLIVRGGSPAENRFYVDGIEIPNINHFSTQGASGGPVGIINADLIQGLDFYSGAFPVQYSGALSSVIDMRLRDGDTLRQSFKLTLGAAEAALSGEGHFSPRTTYIFSLRQSYLQVLFRVLGLPILPNFIDGTFKVKHKISQRDELTMLAIMGFDRLTLNEEGDDETAEYILGYLPTIDQQTVTAGLRYRHFRGDRRYTFVVSHSYLNTVNKKYENNDESAIEGLLLNQRAKDQKTSLRIEERTIFSNEISWRYGATSDYTQYGIDSYLRDSSGTNIYKTTLDFQSFGVYGGLSYKTPSGKMSFALSARMDGNTFSKQTQRFWQQFSPRLVGTYNFNDKLSLSQGVGLYHAMPPLTALSYKENGEAVNKGLDYIKVTHYTLGLDWQARESVQLSAELFLKDYSKLPVSIERDIPLSDLGDDYGIIGNEPLSQQGKGRAYGLELLGRWSVPDKVSLVASLTFFRSEYSVDEGENYRPSSWDSRFIANISGTYFLKKGWSVGAKLSATGGTPYTPYDLSATADIINWDLTGRPVFDYSLYNTLRLDSYAQLDLRIDKMLYFKKWMLGFYLDIQNVSGSIFKEADIPLSDGTLSADDGGKYNLKYISGESGTLIPTFGISAQF